MAKTVILDEAEETRIPFLRGILTRSLIEIGVPFEQAYQLATRVRQDLDGAAEITTEALRERVVELLTDSQDAEIVERYQAPPQMLATVLVYDESGQPSAFSDSRLQHCMEGAGLSITEAAMATHRIHEHLLEQGIKEISSADLGHLAFRCLLENLGRDKARRFMVWVDFVRSGRPLLILIGGITGSGKSTVATEIAQRLGIVRTQSTDMLREVMRSILPAELLPVLHSSSFHAWSAIPEASRVTGENADWLAQGYLNQVELLAVPSEAVIERALRERVSLILEGVHVNPGFLDRIPEEYDVVVVPVMLSVRKKKVLQNRLQGRRSKAPSRGVSHHLEHFDEIWQLQSFLLSEADRTRMLIIDNEDIGKAVQLITDAVSDRISRDFSSSPRQVFS